MSEVSDGSALPIDRNETSVIHRRAKDFLRCYRRSERTGERIAKGNVYFSDLGDNDVAYLDCTGSGSETRAHLLASDDKRLTIMFCAFDGDPVILRLYGQAQSLMRGTPGYDALLGHFEEIPGARQIVRLAVDLVQTSCGTGVPLYDYKDDRSNLVSYWDSRTPEHLRKYWGLKNMASIDGLETGFMPSEMIPPEES